jgi:hypothetical protein
MLGLFATLRQWNWSAGDRQVFCPVQRTATALARNGNGVSSLLYTTTSCMFPPMA